MKMIQLIEQEKRWPILFRRCSLQCRENHETGQVEHKTGKTKSPIWVTEGPWRPLERNGAARSRADGNTRLQSVAQGQEVNSMVPFKITDNTLKNLRINRTKNVDNLYEENFQTLEKKVMEGEFKKIEKYASGWAVNIMKMSILPNQYTNLI